MEIYNYGHACFKVKDDDVSVIFDPYQDNSVPGLKLPKNIKANFVFCSHDHYDHNAKEKIEIIPTDKKINIINVLLPHDKVGGKSRGMSYARVIKFSDYSICHLGDIGSVDDALKHDELKNIDVVLCPINGFYTISALEAIELKKKMNWKCIIPMHYEDNKNRCGYPDGNQIEIFKKEIKNFINICVVPIDINDFNLSYDAIISLAIKKGDNNND